MDTVSLPPPQEEGGGGPASWLAPAVLTGQVGWGWGGGRRESRSLNPGECFQQSLGCSAPASNSSLSKELFSQKRGGLFHLDNVRFLSS